MRTDNFTNAVVNQYVYPKVFANTYCLSGQQILQCYKSQYLLHADTVNMQICECRVTLESLYSLMETILHTVYLYNIKKIYCKFSSYLAVTLTLFLLYDTEQAVR